MTTILKKTMVPIIILGLIMIVCSFAFGEQLTYIQKEEFASGLYWYKIDLHSYVLNLQNNLNIDFRSLIPQAPATPTFDWTDVATLGTSILAKVIFLIANWIIFVIGYTVLLPIKITMYVIIVIIALLGVHAGGIGDIAYTVYNWNIPYLDYSLIG